MSLNGGSDLNSFADECPYYIDPFSDKRDIISGFEGKDYSDQISEEKSKLLSLLSGINLDGISGDELVRLGNQIKQIGGKIGLYILAKGNKGFIEEKLFNKVENNKYNEIEPINKNLDFPTLEDVNGDIKKQVQLASIVVEAIVKSLDKSSGEDISKSGDEIMEVGYELQRLEILKKSLEIKGGLI